MIKRKSMSDEQLYALIRESHPPEESFPPAAAETEGDRVLSQILASDRNESEQPRRYGAKRRRGIIRTGTLSVGAVLVLSGSALAAGSALGVIELGGGDTAETLATVPVQYQRSNGTSYQVNVPSGTAYTYKLAGGESNLICANPELLVESNRQLSSEELHQLLLEESAGATHVRSDTLPPGVVSIGESCIPVHLSASSAQATAEAQVEAEAEGWTAEKFREQIRERATGGIANLQGLTRASASGSGASTDEQPEAEAATKPFTNGPIPSTVERQIEAATAGQGG
jgi:hypothetical protein